MQSFHLVLLLCLYPVTSDRYKLGLFSLFVKPNASNAHFATDYRQKVPQFIIVEVVVIARYGS